MSLYAIADLHLSLNGEKPMDVFRGWQNYVQRLEDNWTRVVGEQDTVLIAGDISWAMKLEDAVLDFRFLHRLPGNKILLKGNHDYWWSTRNKIDHFLEEQGFSDMRVLHNCAYLVEGKALCGTRGWLYNSETAEDKKIVAREAGRLRMSLEDAKKCGGEPVVFLHYPPVYDDMACTEILEILVKEGIRHCYFGHIHGQYAAQKALVGEYEGVKMHLISADHLQFYPIRVE